MSYKRSILTLPFLLITLLLTAPLLSIQARQVIPKPVSLEHREGQFELNQRTSILISEDSDEMRFLGSYVADMIRPATWMEHKVQIGHASADTSIFLTLDTEGSYPGPEAYHLNVSPDGILVGAPTTAGLFYGIQTLRQLFPAAIEYSDPSPAPNAQSCTIPASAITHPSRFEYRGMHLDVARHFFPVEFVKKYIDLLAMHKMNRFHWHLTDDQGWRIEIKKYPKLTTVGAWRDSTLIGHYGTDTYDNIRHGGYYTQEEIKAVVAYAQDRNVTIIPEIEMPGHSSAALAAYPEFGCMDKKYHVQPTWGIFEDIFCPKEETFTFLENVLLEVMDLFPSKYIHIGGDEAPKVQWKESKIAQEVINREGLKNEHELQSYFITRMENFLNQHDRQIIGWDEILEGGLAPKATVMSWRGEKGGIEAAKMKHDVIMTPGGTNYFDHYQANPRSEPLAIGGLTTLKNVYQYDPIPEELNKNEEKYILGAQANLWTEYIHSGKKAEYMAYPRAIALSEVLWSPEEDKNWLEFWARLQTHFERLDIINVNYAPHFRGSLTGKAK